MHPAAAVPHLARELLIGAAVIGVALEVKQSVNSRPEAGNADKGSRLVLLSSEIVGAAVAAMAARWIPNGAIHLGTASAWIGLGVLWCGIALRFWSFRTLGRYFTFTVQTSHDQPVIKSGPYRIIRHPSYGAILLAVIGIGLLVGNWWSLVGLVAAVTCGLAFRIGVEERALLRDLGDNYRDYAATHKRLVPFIW